MTRAWRGAGAAVALLAALGPSGWIARGLPFDGPQGLPNFRTLIQLREPPRPAPTDPRRPFRLPRARAGRAFFSLDTPRKLEHVYFLVEGYNSSPNLLMSCGFTIDREFHFVVKPVPQGPVSCDLKPDVLPPRGISTWLYDLAGIPTSRGPQRMDGPVYARGGLRSNPPRSYFIDWPDCGIGTPREGLSLLEYMFWHDPPRKKHTVGLESEYFYKPWSGGASASPYAREKPSIPPGSYCTLYVAVQYRDVTATPLRKNLGPSFYTNTMPLH